jgi:hypothetical protein
MLDRAQPPFSLGRWSVDTETLKIALYQMNHEHTVVSCARVPCLVAVFVPDTKFSRYGTVEHIVSYALGIGSSRLCAHNP